MSWQRYFFISFCLNIIAHTNSITEKYPEEMAHLPSPLPDRVVLTWNDDPSSTQAVNWRTDVSVLEGIAQLSIANSNGRALDLKEVKVPVLVIFG